MSHEIQQGKWCQFQILTQDGPLSRRVCQVTSDLLRLADQCYEQPSLDRIRAAFPPGTVAGNWLGATVGSEFHKILYLLAADARERGLIEPRLKVTRPTNLSIDPRHTMRGERSAAGPDFVLSGIFDGEDIHAAWDLTTIESISSHYDRDILGIRRRGRRRDPDSHPIDPEIQQAPDTERFWTSYIALYY